jgi:hypothetical protein
MAYFAVVDTETNWHDSVMSIGVVIADETTFEPVTSKYYILTPENKIGGMFSNTMYLTDIKIDLESSRKDVISHIKNLLNENGVKKIFAYNATFDYRHLPELSAYEWYDIMSLAANRQYNPKIPADAECHSTGRLKKDYGVESILRMLNDSSTYSELHNALTDAFDELKIIAMLNQNLNKYVKLNKLNNTSEICLNKNNTSEIYLNTNNKSQEVKEMDIISILESLRAERPVFHSEKDFQKILAQKIQSQMPTAEITLEYPHPADPAKRIDILVKDGGFVYPIELKYPSKKISISDNDEDYNLKEQGAQDCGRYDFIKDICRIESFRDSVDNFKKGIVIWLTNDPSYWNAPKHDNVIFREFTVHEDAELKGVVAWKEGASIGSIKGREAPLVLKGVYTTHWNEYSSFDVQYGLFRYAVHIIE